MSFHKYFACFIFCISMHIINAQINSGFPSIPFGSNTTYENGVMPTGLATGGIGEVAALYDKWMTDHVFQCTVGQAKRVISNDVTGNTTSIDQAFAMLLAAYAGDKAQFDALFAFFSICKNNSGLMQSETNNCNGVATSGREGSSSDADLHIAMALIIASIQWQETGYAEIAKTQIQAIRENLFRDDKLLLPGSDYLSGASCICPAYFAPAYFRIFSEFDIANSEFWNNVITASNELLIKNSDSNTGLISDNSDPLGIPNSCLNSPIANYFGSMAYMNPLHMAIDVLWNGDNASQASKQISGRLSNWIKGYETTYRAPIQQNEMNPSNGQYSNILYSPLLLPAMTENKESLDAGFTALLSSGMGEPALNEASKLLTLFVMSGNFWNPQSPCCKPQPQTLMFNAEGNNYPHIGGLTEFGTLIYTTKEAGASVFPETDKYPAKMVSGGANGTDSCLKISFDIPTNTEGSWVTAGFNVNKLNQDSTVTPIGIEAAGATGISLYHKGLECNMYIYTDIKNCNGDLVYFEAPIHQSTEWSQIKHKWSDFIIQDYNSDECNTGAVINSADIRKIVFSKWSEIQDTGSFYIDEIMLEGVEMDLSGRIADKNTLKAKIEQAKNQFNGKIIGNEIGNYLPSSVNRLQNSIAEAEAVDTNLEAHQPEADLIVEKLTEEIAVFNNSAIVANTLLFDPDNNYAIDDSYIVNSIGTAFYTYEDQLGQGNSTVDISVTSKDASTDSCLLIKYAIEAGSGSPSAGFGFNIDQKNYIDSTLSVIGTTANASTGISLHHKGESISLQLIMDPPSCPNAENVNYSFEIPRHDNWQVVDITWDKIGIPDWGYTQCSEPANFDISRLQKIDFNIYRESSNSGNIYIDKLKLEGTKLDFSNRIANRKALRDTTLTATALNESAIAGSGNGQYPQEFINNLRSALSSADSSYYAIEINQQYIDLALENLTAALSDFRTSKIKVDLTALEQKVSEAKTLKESAKVGDKKGEYDESYLTGFGQKIDTAEYYLNKQYVTSTEIENALASLNSDITWFQENANSFSMPHFIRIYNSSYSNDTVKLVVNDTLIWDIQLLDIDESPADVPQEFDIAYDLVNGSYLSNGDTLSSSDETDINATITPRITQSISLAVNVSFLKIPVDTITANPCGIQMMIGETTQEPITVNILPENATVRTWHSSLTPGISFDEDNRITASAKGEQIMVFISDDNEIKQQQCTLFVALYEPVSIRSNDISVVVGGAYPEKIDFTAEYETEISEYKDSSFMFTSDNINIVQVDETNGTLTFGTETGSTSIFIKYKNNPLVTDTVTVTVSEKIIHTTDVSLDTNKLILTVDDFYQFNTEIIGENGEIPTNNKIFFKSLDPEIAAISIDGKLSAQKEGFTRIVAFSDEDESVSDTCAVTVEPYKITSIILEQAQELSLFLGDTLTVKYTYEPVKAQNDILFESKNGTVSVTPNGFIKALQAGTDTIVVYSAGNAGVFQKIAVSVTNKPVPVTNIYLPENITGTIGQTELTVTIDSILPYDHDETQITFHLVSGGENIEIDSLTGIIKNTDATNSPMVKVIAKTTDRSVSSNICTLEFFPSILHITEVNIQADSIDGLKKGDKAKLEYSYLPQEATINNESFFSTNKELITIDNNGNWEVIAQPAFGKGDAMVKIGIEVNQTFSDTLVMIVSETSQPPVAQSISIMPFIGLEKEGIYQYEVLFEPEGSTATLVWKSTDDDIATVSDGKVTAKEEGTVKIIAFSPTTGLTAYSLLTVAKQKIAAESINLPAKLSLTKETATMLKAIVTPMDATEKNIIWSSSDDGIAMVNNMGVVKATGLGTAEIAARLDNGAISTCSVTVTASMPPQLVLIPEFTTPSGTVATIELSHYLQDDLTPAENLAVNIKSADSVDVIITGTQLKISPQNTEFEGTERLIAEVTDAEGQTVEIPFAITFSNKIDKAPEIMIEEINIDTAKNVSKLQLADIVNDDFSTAGEISWKVENSENFTAKIENNELTIIPNNETLQVTDTILLTATDNNQNTSVKQIVVGNTQKENTPPLIRPIPDQTTESMVFLPINLNAFVHDDYTQPSEIVWEIETSMKLAVTIINNACFVQVKDASWTGTEMLTFTAYDEAGLSSSTEIAFCQNHSSEGIWTGKPNIDFNANRYKTTPSGIVQLYADVMGADGLRWTINDAQIDDIFISNPKIKFNAPGKYAVKLLAQNTHGIDSLIRKEYISVYGIQTNDTILCQGHKLKLEAHGSGTYEWSTGSDSSSAIITGTNSQTYWLTITDGIVQLQDSININIPAVASLGRNFNLCAGEVYPLKLQNKFESYQWTISEESEEATVTASKIGQYAVEVVDSLGCVSRDTVAVENIFELPSPEINFEDTICLGKTSILTAAPDLAYKWNTAENSRSIKVSEAGTYSVTVTDFNRCSNSKSVRLTVLKPYKEKLGLATFSDNSESVVLAWKPTQGQRTEHYEVMKEVATGVYETIHKAFVGDSTYFVDTSANVRQQAYKYKLRTYDSVCNNFTDSDPHRTMHLTKGLTTDANEVALNWNNYIGLPVSNYLVMKRSNGVWSQIGTVTPQDTLELNRFNDTNYKIGDNYRISFELNGKLVVSQLKTDSGPFSHSISNIAEVELTGILEGNLHLNIYPVPVIESLMIEPDFVYPYEIAIYSSDGKLVLSDKAKGKKQINASNMQKGGYFIIITSKDGSAKQMFIKK